MARDIGILSLLTMPALMFVGFCLAEPQLALLACIWGGELRAEAVPVFEFEAGKTPARSKIIRLGCLSLRAPDSTGRETIQVDDGAVRVEAEGMCALLFRPRPAAAMMLPTEYLDLRRLPSHLAQDPGALLAAAYAAGSQDLSIWMNPSQVDTLKALLEAKTALCATVVHRVERMSTPCLSGVLTIYEHDDCIHMVLEYWSRDAIGDVDKTRVGGIVSLLVDPNKPQAMDLARTLIGSLAID